MPLIPTFSLKGEKAGTCVDTYASGRGKKKTQAAKFPTFLKADRSAQAPRRQAAEQPKVQSITLSIAASTSRITAYPFN